MENDKLSVGTGEESVKRSNALVRAAVLVGVAILLNVFLAYLVRVFYLEPIFTDFCPERQVVESIADREKCVSVGGQWTEPDPSQSALYGKEGVFGSCNEQFSCAKDFEKADALYARNLFIVFVIAGASFLLGGAFLVGSRTVSSGLSLGGVFALLFGSLRYWSDMDDRLRVVVSGFALLSLLLIAWRRFRDE
ncbi:MAG TPA: hypothetical protein VN420_04920 [Candidatus Fimivivens sp.]|nr:hypothetical protein [Candidatus Fimivivens sp.]